MARSSYKALKRSVGKAVHHYDMIADGDRLAVGLSGGADSLTMMWFLKDRLIRVPIRYEVFAVYIDPGFEDGFSDTLVRYCEEMGYSLRVEQTDYGPLSHSDVNRENPCFLCSRLRRKRLFEVADELGCRKLALGHNKDDIIETLFLNMCYAGEISTMQPLQPLFQGEFTVIRPLAFSDEEMIPAVCKGYGFSGIHQSLPQRRDIQAGRNQGDAENALSVKPKNQGKHFSGDEPCKAGVSVTLGAAESCIPFTPQAIPGTNR